MVITFLATMIILTTIIITIVGIIGDGDIHIHPVIYGISACWQFVAVFISVMPAPGIPTKVPIYYFSNFTYNEFLVIWIGISIGIATAIVIILDYGFYKVVVDRIRLIQQRWQETFPTKVLTEEKPIQKKKPINTRKIKPSDILR